MTLQKAIEADDAEAVRKAVKRIKNVNAWLKGAQNTPLSLAAKAGKPNAVDALLAAGADPHQPDFAPSRALPMAVEGGHVDLVRRLLAATPPTPEELHAATSKAVRGSGVEILVLLNDAGAPLAPHASQAARFGWATVLRWMLAHGVPVETRSDNPNDANGTLLHLAARSGRGAVVRALIDAGADLNARDAAGFTPLHLAAAHEVAGVSWDRRNRHSVAEAQREGRFYSVLPFGDPANYTAVEALLDAGADAHATDAQGNDALRLFHAHNARKLNPGDAERKYEEFPNQADFCRDLARRIESRLLAAGLKANDADDRLVEAARDGDLAAVRQAIADGARLNARNPADNQGYSALGRAALHGHADVVRALVDAGADIEDGGQADFNARPYSVLACAARNADVPVDLLQFLVDRGADVNPANADESPLLAAVISSNDDHVRFLLDRGADPSAPAPDGDEIDTPLGRAKLLLPNAKANRQMDEVKALENIIAMLKAAGSRAPAPSEPFAPGVDLPDTFTELLVQAPLADVAAAVARSIGGRVEPNAWGRELLAGPRSYAVIRLDGSDWCSVLGTTGADRILDDAWDALAADVAARLSARALLLCHEDTSSCTAWRLYNGPVREELFEEGLEELEDVPGIPPSAVHGKFESAIPARPRPERPFDALKAYATNFRFRTLNYGPWSEAPAQPFTFEILGLKMKVADAAYVTT